METVKSLYDKLGFMLKDGHLTGYEKVVVTTAGKDSHTFCIDSICMPKVILKDERPKPIIMAFTDIKGH